MKNVIKTISILLMMITFSFGQAQEFDTGGKNPDRADIVYHFGYGSNLDEDYMRQWTPSLKFVTKAQLPNFEIQFRKYSTDLEAALFQNLAASLKE